MDSCCVALDGSDKHSLGSTTAITIAFEATVSVMFPLHVKFRVAVRRGVRCRGAPQLLTPPLAAATLPVVTMALQGIHVC